MCRGLTARGRRAGHWQHRAAGAAHHQGGGAAGAAAPVARRSGAAAAAGGGHAARPVPARTASAAAQCTKAAARAGAGREAGAAAGRQRALPGRVGAAEPAVPGPAGAHARRQPAEPAGPAAVCGAPAAAPHRAPLPSCTCLEPAHGSAAPGPSTLHSLLLPARSSEFRLESGNCIVCRPSPMAQLHETQATDAADDRARRRQRRDVWKGFAAIIDQVNELIDELDDIANNIALQARRRPGLDFFTAQPAGLCLSGPVDGFAAAAQAARACRPRSTYMRTRSS